MSVLVVTGTSTEVGKTVVTAAIAVAAAAERGQAVCVCKPVQTGLAETEPGDAAEASRLAGVQSEEFVRYPEPLSPDIAARRSGRRLLSKAELAARIDELANDKLVIVEGAGGVLVRLGADDTTVLDLAAALRAPMLVVASPELGTLNHTELTVRAIRAAGVTVAGLVLGRWPAQPQLVHRTNLAAFPDQTGVSVIGKVPDGAGASRPEDFQSQAPGWFDETQLAGLWQTIELVGLKENDE